MSLRSSKLSLMLVIAAFEVSSCRQALAPLAPTSSVVDVCAPLAGDIGTVSPALSIEQIEAESLVGIKGSPGTPQIPFGHSNSQWLALKANLQAGDSLHQYRSADSGGYLVLRQHCLVGQLQTWAR
jgi:hypothetical protein